MKKFPKSLKEKLMVVYEGIHERLEGIDTSIYNAKLKVTELETIKKEAIAEKAALESILGIQTPPSKEDTSGQDQKENS